MGGITVHNGRENRWLSFPFFLFFSLFSISFFFSSFSLFMCAISSSSCWTGLFHSFFFFVILIVSFHCELFSLFIKYRL